MENEQRVFYRRKNDKLISNILSEFRSSLTCLHDSFKSYKETDHVTIVGEIEKLKNHHANIVSKLDENTVMTRAGLDKVNELFVILERAKWFWAFLEKCGKFVLWLMQRWIIIVTAIASTYALLKVISTEKISDLIDKLFK